MTVSGHPTASDEPWWHGSPCGAWSETEAGADRHEESCVACLAAIVVVERERADRAEDVAASLETTNRNLARISDERLSIERAYGRGQRARADTAEAALQRVRQVHHEVPNPWWIDGDGQTGTYGPTECAHDHHRWPCPTVAVVDPTPKETL